MHKITSSLWVALRRAFEMGYARKEIQNLNKRSTIFLGSGWFPSLLSGDLGDISNIWLVRIALTDWGGRTPKFQGETWEK